MDNHDRSMLPVGWSPLEGGASASFANSGPTGDPVPQVAYFSVGTDGLIRWADARTASLLGYRMRELEGRVVFDLCADTVGGRVRALELFRRFVRGGGLTDERVELRASDGRSVWARLSIQPIRDATGRVKSGLSWVRPPNRVREAS